MKKTNLRLIPLLIFALMFSLSACKKEGCTDSKASNHDKEAEKDDGSCVYDFSAVFWINAITSQTLQNSFISELKIFVDDVLIGKMSTNSSLLEAPACNAGGISFNESGSVETTKVINYKATFEQQTGPNTFSEETKYEGSIKLTGGVCQPFQLQ